MGPAVGGVSWTVLAGGSHKVSYIVCVFLKNNNNNSLQLKNQFNMFSSADRVSEEPVAGGPHMHTVNSFVFFLEKATTN